MDRSNKVPVLVKVISGWYYFMGALAIILGLALILGSQVLAEYLEQIADTSYLGIFGETALIVAGVIALITGVVRILIATGLWQGKNWARIVVIIFSVLGVISGLVTLFSGGVFAFVVFLINAGIAAYLIFSPEVKRAFR